MKYNLTLLFALLSSLGFAQSINQYHRTDISDLTSTSDLNQPLSTFDYQNPTGAPVGWHNVYVSTHGNYLHSFIIHKHRTDDWYLGWMEENRKNPVWLKIYHTGNDGNLAKLDTENIFQKNIKVNATLYATEIKVEAQTADFVFEENYQLKSLEEVEQFVRQNKHLPDVPSSKQMEEEGVGLAAMNKLLLQKVEELTLHIIDLNKRIENIEIKSK